MLFKARFLTSEERRASRREAALAALALSSSSAIAGSIFHLTHWPPLLQERES